MMRAKLIPSILLIAAATVAPTFAEEVKHHVTLRDVYNAPELHVPVPEAPQVVEVFRRSLTFMVNGDAKGYAELLTDDCSFYDEDSKRELNGKEKVVAGIKPKFDANAKATTSKEIIAERPYVKVTGDSATVIFKLITKEGAKTTEHLSTNIFVKTKDGWKKSFDRGNWGLKN